MNTIVVGSLNTDLIATGIKEFPKPGEHVYGRELLISPGGKSRNIADMAARLLPQGSVAMVGRTVKDKYGLWELPVKALKDAGVNTDYINILHKFDGRELPGIALIPVDVKGNNQIIVLPGVSNNFSPKDINNALLLFEEVGRQNGVLILTMECPQGTAYEAVKKANQFGIKVMFDPGGVQKGDDVLKILELDIYLIKPNEHEASVLTGIDVKDFASAKQAADSLRQKGLKNILITAGSAGAYLFTSEIEKHIGVPEVDAEGRDETGCGDQTMAALCAYIQTGKSVEQAAEIAVLAGTLQFYKAGVKPLEKKEIEDIL